MGKNVQRYEWRMLETGDYVLIAIPFNCACGKPANYGKDGAWYCTFCWQEQCKEV